MKKICQLAAWAVVSLLIVYVAFNPENGVAYQSPMTGLGLGLIGLGLCKNGRQRLATQTVPH
jgi:hypothetical protein